MPPMNEGVTGDENQASEMERGSLREEFVRPGRGTVSGVPGLDGVVLSASERKELREQGHDNNP